MLKLRDGFQGERSIILPDMIRRLCKSDLLLNQLYITDIGYYPHATYHYRERPNGIEQYILIYCLKGSGWYKVRDKRYEVKENQWFIIPQGQPHVYASNNDDPWTIYWLHFTGHMAPFYGDNHQVPKAISSDETSRISDRIEIFEEIFLALSDSYSLDNLRYAASLLYGFLASLCYLQNFRKYNTAKTRLDKTDTVGMAVHYMQENLERKLTLADIANYTGYSVSQLSLLFRNGTGHSPLNYFNMLKIQKACQLLESSDMKINQICTKVGIDDSYYFSRLFTKIVGIPPKRYRNSVATRP